MIGTTIVHPQYNGATVVAEFQTLGVPCLIVDHGGAKIPGRLVKIEMEEVK